VTIFLTSRKRYTFAADIKENPLKIKERPPKPKPKTPKKI